MHLLSRDPPTHRACRCPERRIDSATAPSKTRENRPDVLSAIGRVTRMPDRHLHAGPSGRPRVFDLIRGRIHRQGWSIGEESAIDVAKNPPPIIKGSLPGR